MINTHFSGSAAAKGHQVLQTVCLNWPKALVPEQGETVHYLSQQGAQFEPTRLQAKLQKQLTQADLLKAPLFASEPPYRAFINKQLLPFLKVSGLNLNGRDNQGMTVLHRAVRHAHTDVVRQLLNTPGVEINPRDFRLKQTPLGLAKTKKHQDVVDLLHATCQAEE